MRYKYIVFPENEMASSIIRKFSLKESDALIINKESKLKELSVLKSDVKVYGLKDKPEDYTFEIFNKMVSFFDNKNLEDEIANTKIFEKELLKFTFININDLKDNDKIVYRDRENPNMHGIVAIKNSKIYINAQEYIENSYTHKNIRVIKPGTHEKDYYLPCNVGLRLYNQF